ncbi:hypothetical protein [Bradyrhizobium erythrophlei]|uniref:Uncharacterized protein n=1 Tax=Bradyrhizobium erythrophlei TaxID=1437360 RepID=A0A1M5NJY3_9BRAD|nr:hypothetical protein [Bradyrhizobium erythrophlei]SHG89886.1 hypothetical protein SAMN05443248_3026 [Bradyrhizobium erythrophlei]
MSYYEHQPSEDLPQPDDTTHDVTWLRRVAVVFLIAVLACIALAVFVTHKTIPNRPQVAVVATPSPEINTAESEGKAATSIEDNAAPSHSVLDEDWHPYLKGTLDAPAPEAPVADEAPAPVANEVTAPEFQQSGPETTPAVETAPVADAALPRATAADEAQHAHDHPAHRRRHHYHRPHHHYHHQPQPQPRRHVSACPDYAIDYYDPFAALFHGIECLIEEMIQ